jgi:hypothetical protein
VGPSFSSPRAGWGRLRAGCGPSSVPIPSGGGCSRRTLRWSTECLSAGCWSASDHGCAQRAGTLVAPDVPPSARLSPQMSPHALCLPLAAVGKTLSSLLRARCSSGGHSSTSRGLQHRGAVPAGAPSKWPFLSVPGRGGFKSRSSMMGFLRQSTADEGPQEGGRTAKQTRKSPIGAYIQRRPLD